MTLLLTTLCLGLAELAPRHSIPDGAYQVARLELTDGWAGHKGERATLPMLLGLRGGKPAALWLLHPEASGLTPRLRVSSLRLAGETLQGELKGWASGDGWGGGHQIVHEFAFSLDARLAGGKLTGTFSGAWTRGKDKVDAKGMLSGTLREPGRVEKDWPGYYGDGWRLSGPPNDTALLTDLAKAVPVWKSELHVPTCHGSGPDSRYATRAGWTGPNGGSSSPVVAGGRVYQFFTRPAGPIGLHPHVYGGTDEQFAAYVEKAFPGSPEQQALLRDFFRLHANEVLACLDAGTGRVLWEAVFPSRGCNLQTHKHRGHYPVPLVAGGVVYCLGTTGRVYALDAVTGKLKWEYPDAPRTPAVTKSKGIQCGSPSPVLVGGVLIVNAGGLLGLDPATGKQKWKLDGAFSGSLLPWTKGEAARVFALRVDHGAKKTFLVGIDPATGKTALSTETALQSGHVSPLLADDTLVGWSVASKKARPGEDDGDVTVHAYRVKADGVEKLWAVVGPSPMVDTPALVLAGSSVFVTGFTQTFRLDLGTGKKLGVVQGVGGARTQVAVSAGGSLLVQPEGRHGKQSFFLLDAAESFVLRPASGKASGTHPNAPGQWSPPHPYTTAYANQPLVSPVVDGRIIIRGRDALYCYDLRPEAKRR